MKLTDHIPLRKYLAKKDSSGKRINREYILDSMAAAFKNKLHNLLDEGSVEINDDGNYHITIDFPDCSINYLINKKLVD